MLYSVLVSAFQFLQNLNHDQGKLQVDNDLVKLKVLYKSRVSKSFLLQCDTLHGIYIYIYMPCSITHCKGCCKISKYLYLFIYSRI